MDLLGAGRPASKPQADQQVVVVAGRNNSEVQGHKQRRVPAANRGVRIERLQQRWAGPGKILGGQPQAKLIAAAPGVGDLAQVADQVVQFRLAGRVCQLGSLESCSPGFVGGPAQPHGLHRWKPKRPVLGLLLAGQPGRHVANPHRDADQPLLLDVALASSLIRRGGLGNGDVRSSWFTETRCPGTRGARRDSG